MSIREIGQPSRKASEASQSHAGTEKIVICGGVKVPNPCSKSDLLVYQGDLGGYNFGPQARNYEAINESLGRLFGISLDYIWVGHYQGKTRGGGKGGKRTQFLVKSSDGNFYWRKYESPAPGSGQNWVYLKGKRMKTTQWLNMSDEERKQAFEG